MSFRFNSKTTRMGVYLPLMATVGDLICLNFSYLLTSFAIFNVFDPIVYGLLNVSFFCSFYKFYRLHQQRAIPTENILAKILLYSSYLYLYFVALLYFLSIFQRKEFLLILFLVSCTVVSIWTVICNKTLWIYRAFGYNYESAVVVGTAKTAMEFIEQLNKEKGYGIRVVTVVDDGLKTESEKISNNIISFDELDKYLNENRVDKIYYASDITCSEYLIEVMQSAEKHGLSLNYIVRLPNLIGSQFTPTVVAGMPAMVHTLSPLFYMRNKLIKRAFDLAVSVPFLIVSPLIFIPIAIGIKLTSPGPVFFKQKRTGLYGKDFVCLKFRTMRVNNDSDKLQATKNDPRKTAFGNFLRKTSMDELPQFINVFLGNMSVVGPRPHMTSQTEDYRKLIDKYMIRHAVKPGITGLAQVRGYRGATEHLWQMEKRVEHDVEYIIKWNLLLDIKIFCKTVMNALHGEENAY